MNYYTSDFHFCDKNIIKYQYKRNEYGNDIASITNNLINRQNSQVAADDNVYVLGDLVCGNNINDVITIINRLNGKIILLLGNHDHMFNDNHSTILENKFEIKHGILHKIFINNQNIYMFHYPLLEQPNFHNNNSYHLHGHVHGDISQYNKRAIDVSCNIYDFRLLSENTIIQMFSKD